MLHRWECAAGPETSIPPLRLVVTYPRPSTIHLEIVSVIVYKVLTLDPTLVPRIGFSLRRTQDHAYLYYIRAKDPLPRSPWSQKPRARVITAVNLADLHIPSDRTNDIFSRVSLYSRIFEKEDRSFNYLRFNRIFEKRLIHSNFFRKKECEKFSITISFRNCSVCKHKDTQSLKIYRRSPTFLIASFFRRINKHSRVHLYPSSPLLSG